MISNFYANYKIHPNYTALITNDKKYTYKELFYLAAGIAQTIDATKKNSNEPLIGILTDNTVHTYSALLGILFSGAGFVPLNMNFPKERLVEIIKHSGLKTIVYTGNQLELLLDIIKLSGTPINCIESGMPLKGKLDYIPKFSPLESIAYLLYTSGSTGLPKGIAISNKNFNAFIQNMAAGGYDFKSDDRFLNMFELSFDVSIACIFLAWKAGACLVSADKANIVFIEALNCIKKHKITVVVLTPSSVSFMKQLRLLKDLKFPFVRYSFLTGEALSHTLAQTWQKVAANSIVVNAYGPTEATVWSFLYQWNRNTSSSGCLNGLVPIGKPLPNLDYTLINQHQEGANQAGELLLSGEQVAHGYWNDEKRSRFSFKKDHSGKLYYHTGDRVQMNTFGNIVYINRIDYQVKIDGYRVEPGEIEFRIRQYTKIENVAVFSIHKNESNCLIAVIENIGEQIEALKEYLPTVLQTYMLPRQIVDIPIMPLNTSGKIDRQKLMQLFNG